MDSRCFVLLTEYLNRYSEVILVFLCWIHSCLAFYMKAYVCMKDFKVWMHPILMYALIVNVLIWYWSKGLHGYLGFGGISNNASINVWRLIENAFKKYYRHLENAFKYWYWKAFWKNASKDLLSPVYSRHFHVCLNRFFKAFWPLLKAFLNALYKQPWCSAPLLPLCYMPHAIHLSKQRVLTNQT